MALFVLSAVNSKQLVIAWAKHLSATERSSRVNMVLTRQMTHFLHLLFEPYLLEHLIFAFQDFKTFKIQFHEVPLFALCLVCKI